MAVLISSNVLSTQDFKNTYYNNNGNLSYVATTKQIDSVNDTKAAVNGDQQEEQHGRPSARRSQSACY